MAAQEFDLNNPIDWDTIGEWEGPAHTLDYHFEWTDGGNGANIL